jgi:hypothetical protein
MSSDKQTEHIPSTNEAKEQDEQKGSGGLLSAIGDPAGTSRLSAML